VGKERGLSLVIGLQVLTSLVIGLLVLARAKERPLRWAGLAVPALAGLFLCFYFPAWNRLLLARSKYHRLEAARINVRAYGWLEALLRGPEILPRFEGGELVYYGEGIGGFTTVLKYTDAFGNIDYTLAISAKPDASSRGDMETQTVCSHFPMLFHPNPKTVMVLGLASGVTTGEVLYYPIDKLDILEINDQVVTASDFFIPWNNNVLSDPRTNLIIQDARAHLQLTKQKYDVIISEPSNPWMAGLATLFTRDFFELAENRLNQNGIFVQFIHSYEMDWYSFAIVGRTFARVFPNSLLLATAPSTLGDDYMLIGFKGTDRVRLENSKAKLPFISRLKNVALSDPKLLYRLIVSEDLRNLFGVGPINTDNFPLLEFAAPKLMYQSDPELIRKIQSQKRLTPETLSVFEQAVTDVDLQIDLAAYAFSVYEPFPKMVDLSQATAAQKERFFKLFDNYCANNPMDYSIFRDDQLKQRCRSVQKKALEGKIDRLPDKAYSYFYLAELCYNDGLPDQAIDNYSRALKIKPDFADAYYSLGVVLAQQGGLAQAVEHYTRALQIRPGFVEAHNNLGHALARMGRHDQAVKQFNRSLQIDPENPETYSNLGAILVKQDKLDQAVANFRKALQLKPDFPDAQSNLGYALTKQGKFDQAVEHYTHALQIKPDFAMAYSNLAYALLRQGKLDQAVTNFNEAIRLDPNLAEAHRNLAQTFLRQGKLDQAVAQFAEALRIEPNVARVHNDLGVVLAVQGRLEEAVRHFAEALRINPDYVDARRNLLRAQQRLARPDQNAAQTKDTPQPDTNDQN
ncbi:MAG: tetratricopeptide repeat protein, partial [Planctomycetota bacterium]|jgi:spermidine synthase